MVRLLVLALLAALVWGDERWAVFRSGPFEVFTNGSERPAREALARLEQERHVLGTLLSRPDLVSVWPVRLVLFRSAREAALYGEFPALEMARDAFTAAGVAGTPLPRRWLRDVAGILIEANAGRMPAYIEEGLMDLLSTLEAAGSRVELGAPPPPAERTKNWARMHLLAVNEEYSGKLRVLLANLQRGIDLGPSFTNALGKTPEAVEGEAEAYLAAGAFPKVSVSGRPLNPEKDFNPAPAAPESVKVLLADLFLASRSRQAAARAAYLSILKANPKAAEAEEGLGFLELRAGQDVQARKHFKIAVGLGSKNARAHLEAGALEEAAKLNPLWAEPHLRLARQAEDPRKKTAHLAAAVKLAPRQAAWWKELAEQQFALKLYPESARSWSAALRAAATEEERAALSKAREEMAQRQQDLEAAESRRIAEEKARELERLRNQALEEIRAAEKRASQQNPPLPPGTRIEQWWEGPQAEGKVQGVLERVDCLRGGIARLLIRSEEGKPLQLVIRDPAQVAIEGGGNRELTCGPQRPVRKMRIQYIPKPDAKLASAGEAVFVEFP